MKPFKNYEQTKTYSDFDKIPAGGYEAKIIGAKEVTYNGRNGEYSVFEIGFDIAKGDYKDYYKNEFDNNTNEEKKWKGIVRHYLPKDDGTEKDEWTKRSFKTMIEAIENSNSGFHWDWDEKKLKGKKIGVLLRDEEWEYNGKSGITARPFKLIDLQKIIDGKFKTPNPKMLKKKTDINIMVEDDVFESNKDGFEDFQPDENGDYPF